MKRLPLDAVLGTKVDVDVCTDCRAFWFEPFETLHLTPAATLELFRLIASAAGGGIAPNGERLHCPKCARRLTLAHDRARNTPFRYWRCDREHGRFTSFTDFLKEKNFIQPLTAPQIAELRKKVKTVHCSSCGAPVELVKDSVCRHCGAPLVMLDIESMTKVAADYEREAARPAPPPPRYVLREQESLIDVGLTALNEWLERVLMK